MPYHKIHYSDLLDRALGELAPVDEWVGRSIHFMPHNRTLKRGEYVALLCPGSFVRALLFYFLVTILDIEIVWMVRHDCRANGRSGSLIDNTDLKSVEVSKVEKRTCK